MTVKKYWVRILNIITFRQRYKVKNEPIITKGGDTVAKTRDDSVDLKIDASNVHATSKQQLTVFLNN